VKKVRVVETAAESFKKRARGATGKGLKKFLRKEEEALYYYYCASFCAQREISALKLSPVTLNPKRDYVELAESELRIS